MSVVIRKTVTHKLIHLPALAGRVRSAAKILQAAVEYSLMTQMQRRHSSERPTIEDRKGHSQLRRTSLSLTWRSLIFAATRFPHPQVPASVSAILAHASRSAVRAALMSRPI